MTSTSHWLIAALVLAGLAAIANLSYLPLRPDRAQLHRPSHLLKPDPNPSPSPDRAPTVSSTKLLAELKSKPPAVPKPPAMQKLPTAQEASSGIEIVAGTAATRLKDYLADFSGSSTAELEERLISLEGEVAAADYFRRANTGRLDFAETMAFDDLLTRQEAIHLILLRRKLKRLAGLTARL